MVFFVAPGSITGLRSTSDSIVWSAYPEACFHLYRVSTDSRKYTYTNTRVSLYGTNVSFAALIRHHFPFCVTQPIWVTPMTVTNVFAADPTSADFILDPGTPHYLWTIYTQFLSYKVLVQLVSMLQ